MNRFEIRAPASRRKRDFDEGSAFDWPLLARYFAAELSSEERALLEDRIQADPAYAAEIAELGRRWKAAGALPTTDRTDAIWTALAHEVRGTA